MTRKAIFMITGLLLTALTVFSQAAASSGKTFESPEQAVSALVTAIESVNLNELRAILGTESGDLIESGDAVRDRINALKFLSLYRDQNTLSREEAGIVLVIGRDQWPFPIPLIPEGKRWRFDTAAGKEEILNRRIGGNELAAIDFCHQYAQMQKAYEARDRDGDGFHEYAQTFISAPGRKNGLFWFRRPGETPSPLGPLAAQAFAEGYLQDLNAPRQPYNGYYFRILTAQGAHAPAGARSYIANGGRMTEGFALIAYPVKRGASGVMSFIVNQDDRIFEKDLGPDTESRALRMTAYDPDPSWREEK